MDDLKVSEALRQFYGKENLSDEAFTRSINYVYLGPVPLPFPNLPQRKKIVFLHDLNHLITGCDTSFSGEGEVAAFELTTGFPSHCWVGYLYAPIALVSGLVVNPKRTLQGFQKYRGMKNATQLNLTPQDLDKISVKELKRMAGLPAHQQGEV